MTVLLLNGRERCLNDATTGPYENPQTSETGPNTEKGKLFFIFLELYMIILSYLLKKC